MYLYEKEAIKINRVGFFKNRISKTVKSNHCNEKKWASLQIQHN